MTVQTKFMVSAFVVSAVLGLGGGHAAGTEPIKVPAVIRSNLASERVASGATWTMTPVLLVAETAKSGRGSVASALRQLDLSALTMADFGDVEPAR